MRAKTGLHVTCDQGMGGKLWKSGREESLHPEAGGGGREGPARPQPELWEDFGGAERLQATTSCHMNNCHGRLRGVLFSPVVFSCSPERALSRGQDFMEN